jgi:hypothetical protein
VAFSNGLLRKALANDEHVDMRFGEAQNLLAYLSNTTRVELESCVVFAKDKNGNHQTIIIGTFTGGDLRDYVHQAMETFEGMALAVKMSPRTELSL